MVSNTFERTLRDLRNGEVADELSRFLQDLSVAVFETGKAGSITLKIDIKPASTGGGSAMVIKDKITLKLPELERGSTIMFAAEDGTLQRNDPRQKELQLRAVPGAEPVKPEELRKVS